MATLPTPSPPPVSREISRGLTWLLCGITGAFVVQFGAELVPFRSADLSGLLALSRENILAGRVWTLLTHGILHSTTNILHVAVSLAGVFLLGRELEQTYGTRILFCLLGSSTFVGGLAWLTVTRGENAALVGMTAGVYGLLAYYALAEPGRELRLLVFFTFPLSIRPRQLLAVLASAEAMGLVLIDLLNRPLPFGYAPAAHLGGLATGWACYCFLPRLLGSRHAGLKAHAGLSTPTVSDSETPSKPDADTVSGRSAGVGIREQVDGILDKISREGIAALTVEERRTLDNARNLLNRR